MRKEAKITLTLFVVLGGVVTWYAWTSGGEGDDLALGTADTHTDGAVSTTDADAPRRSGSITSPLRSEPISTIDDDPSPDLMAAVDGGADSPATRPGKRGRRRGGDRSSRATSDDANTRLDSILATLEPASSTNEPADDAAAGTTRAQGGDTGDPTRSAGGSPGDKRTISASTAGQTRRSTPLSDTVPHYTVARGDTMAILAEVHYGSQTYASFLARANPQIENPSKLAVGTRLSIPPLPASMVRESKLSGRSGKPEKSPAAVEIEAGVYVVRDGDSLYRIAEQLLGEASRWPEIHAQNRAVIGDDPTNLKVGQRLRVPGKQESD